MTVVEQIIARTPEVHTTDKGRGMEAIWAVGEMGTEQGETKEIRAVLSLRHYGKAEYGFRVEKCFRATLGRETSDGTSREKRFTIGRANDADPEDVTILTVPVPRYSDKGREQAWAGALSWLRSHADDPRVIALFAPSEAELTAMMKR